MFKFIRLFIALILLVPLFITLGQPFPASSSDPGAKISGDLERVITVKQGLHQPLPAGSARLTQGVNEDADNALVFLYLDRQPDGRKLAELASMGVMAYPDSWIPPVGANPRGFIMATVPINKVMDLAARSDVAWIDSAERQLYETNDAAAQTVAANTFWSGNFNGKGIKVAVLDSGLDTTHPDIPACVASKDFSKYPVLGDNITTHGAHGTHVTGSVLGRGTLSGGRYKGLAWAADLIFLKIENDLTGKAPDAAMVAALRAATDNYSADIINVSFGGFSPFHDGSDALCQTVDYANSKGVAVFISAGNEADDNLHYRLTVGANSTSGYIKINVVNAKANDSTLEHNVVWYDSSGANDTITAAYYDSAKNPLTAETQSTDWKKDGRNTFQRYWWWGDGSKAFYLPSGDSTYYMTLTNTSSKAQLCHIYFNGSTSNYAVNFDQADPFYTLGSPGEADSAITVGSYTHRGSFINYLGENKTRNETVGTVSSFSSRGPRVDSLSIIKPFIVSPGSLVISCRDRISSPLGPFSVSNNGVNDGKGPADYEAMQGTSMASPIAAGCAALMLQSYPGLKGKPEAVKQYLRQSASRSSKPDFTWGYGLFNLQSVLQILPKQASIEAPGGQGKVTYTTDLGTIGDLRGSSSQSTNRSGLGLMPWGAFTYEISLLEPSGWAHVSVDMPDDTPDEYLEYTDSGWTQVPLTSDSGREIDFRLQDGGIGDSDIQHDGTIEDTGGPAIAGQPWMGTGIHPMGSSATATVPSLTPPIISPSMVVQSASISSKEVMPDEPVGLVARVANTSTVSGEAPLKVYVNGEVEIQKAVNLAGGQAVVVEFSMQRNQPGTYYVQVNNVAAGAFTVEDPVVRGLPATLVLIALVGGIVLVSILLWKRCRATA